MGLKFHTYRTLLYLDIAAHLACEIMHCLETVVQTQKIGIGFQVLTLHFFATGSK